MKNKMRIELNSGGLGGSAVISGFQTDFSSLISKSRRVVSSFQVVKTFSNHMNGGIGSLQNAVDQIDARMQQEEAKADALKTAQKKSEDFLELVHTIDEKVSILVNRNKHDFYDKNPWAKPPQPDKAKSYYDKAKDYVCKKVQQVKDGIKNIAKAAIQINKSIADSISKAWDNVKNWCEEHKSAIKKIIIAVGVIAVLGIAAALTGGAAAAIFALAFKGAIVGGIAGSITSAGSSALQYRAENGTWKGASGAIFDSAADGFLSGTITGAATGAASEIGSTLMMTTNMSRNAVVATQMVAGGMLNGTGNAGVTALDCYLDNGTLDNSNKKIIDSFATGFVDGVKFQGITMATSAIKNTVASDISNRISNNTANNFEKFIVENKHTYKSYEKMLKNPWYSSKVDAQSSLFSKLSEYSGIKRNVRGVGKQTIKNTFKLLKKTYLNY